MPRTLRALVLAALTLLLLGIPALAQTPAASPQSTPTQGRLEGLQAGVVRQYAADPTLNPSERPDEFSIISAHVFRFDSADHAAAAWQSLREDGLEQFQPTADAGEVDVNEEERDDIGDQAYVIWLSANLEQGGAGYYRALYVQDGEFLYFLTAIAGNEQNTLVTDELAHAIVDREPGSGSANFDADGTSTGGLWDLLPDPDDDVVANLVPVQDREVTVP